MSSRGGVQGVGEGIQALGRRYAFAVDHQAISDAVGIRLGASLQLQVQNVLEARRCSAFSMGAQI